MSLDKRDAATRAVDKLIEQGLLDKFQKYNIAQVIREEYAPELLSRHEALKAAMREKAAKWRKQAEVLRTDKPDFSDGLAASREEAAAELEALGEKQL